MSKIVRSIDINTVKAGPLPEVAKISRKVAAEGCVLLENNNAALPIRDGERVAVFGRMQGHYIKSGSGSGGLVNVPYVTNIFDSLSLDSDITLDEELAKAYADFVKEHPFDAGDGWANEPWSQPEMELDGGVVDAASKRNDLALVVIARISGEQRDNADVKGSFSLSEGEEKMLEVVTKHFSRVAVVLNVGNIINMDWVKRYGVDAVLYVWQGGMEGGNAAADVLRGRVTPSGKLPDTIAASIADYPSTANFGGARSNKYCEDIYVGYRYFETAAPEKVLYPFGYGLSYTEFNVRVDNVADFGGRINLSVMVENTGKAEGREVVQVYFGAPQGKLGKPLKQLACFAKTKTLAPNEVQTLELGFDIDSMASYDDSGATGNRYCYVLEAGDYDIFVGTDVRTCEKVFTYTIDETVVTQQLEQALAPIEPFERLRPVCINGKLAMKSEPVPLRAFDIFERIDTNMPADIAYTGNKGYILNDVKEGKCTMDEFVAQLDDNDLAAISRGEGMCNHRVTGTGSAFGGVTLPLLKYGIPAVCTSDGPSGLRMPGKVEASLMPSGTLLAATWDFDAVYELFTYEGIEMYAHKVDTLLGPGINIHRHPLNGRNFEYHSEDPLLTGKIAAAQCAALLQCGVTATIKHFCCNSQEFHRNDSDSVVSERALREIYLKPFEIAVKEGGATAIMTSYNKINGVHTACSYDLNTTILRNEWGYTGFVMTDWWTNTNSERALDSNGSKFDKASMVKAQNDVYMVVSNSTAGDNSGDNIMSALESGALTRGELQRNAKNILRYAMLSPAFERFAQADFKVDEVDICDMKTVLTVENPTNDRELIAEAAPDSVYAVVATVSVEGDTLEQIELVFNANGSYIPVFVMGTNGESRDFLTLCKTENGKICVRPNWYNSNLNVLKIEIKV